VKEYVLKHKDVDVAAVRIEKGEIFDLEKIYAPEHLPYLAVEEKQFNIKLLNNWLGSRGIPFSREDYEDIIKKYNVESSKELVVLGMGLNLTDHYWLCESGKQKKWNDVNYFENEFSVRIGEIMPELRDKYENIVNPDLSSNGHLRKIWIIDNKERILCKAGSGDIKQEPFNEYIATRVGERLGLGNYVPYSLGENGEEIWSKCPCMVSKDVEFVDSFIVFLHGEKTGSRYNDYIRNCAVNGIQSAKEEVDKMIVLDYLIRNTDRNNGNYGILRNSNSLKWEKMAPIFDNGNSLWYNISEIENIGMDKRSKCRVFEGENEKNIQLLREVNWLDLKKLDGMGDEIVKILRQNKNMKRERVEKIGKSFDKRVRMLEGLLNGYDVGRTNKKTMW